MLEIENRDDLLEPNFHYPSYAMKDEFIRKVERSLSNSKTTTTPITGKNHVK